MSRQRLKARDKVTRKMTKNGVVERNAVTGENVRISKREADIDLRLNMLERESLSLIGTRLETKKPQVNRKKGKYRGNPKLAENVVATATETSPLTADIIANEDIRPPVGSAELPEIIQRKPLNIPDVERIPQNISQAKLKQPQQYNISDNNIAKSAAPIPEVPQIQRIERDIDFPVDALTSEQQQIELEITSLEGPHKALQFDEPEKLEFDKSETVAFSCEKSALNVQKSKQKHKQKQVVNSDIINNNPLQQAPLLAEPIVLAGHKTHKANNPAMKILDSHDINVTTIDIDLEVSEPLTPERPGKLQFTAEETTPEAPKNRKPAKAQKQAERANAKLVKVVDNLSSKKKLRSKIVVNEETAKSKRKLKFENEPISQSEHLKGSLPLRPVKAIGNTAIVKVHSKIYQLESENTAVEAVHKGEIALESFTRSALRHHKTAPYQKVAKAERNIFSRAVQKRKIKRNYAKEARKAKKNAERAKQAGATIEKSSKAIVNAVRKHPIAAIALVLGAFLMFAIMSMFSLFSSIGSGSLGGILSASYLAEDADIDYAELAYSEWETDLQIQIANTETDYPNYDEYRYSIGDISHNPYELIAYLTAKYQNFTSSTAQAELNALFGEQYSLLFTPSVETHYADASDYDRDGDYEPYDWNVLTITLMSKSFSDIVTGQMNSDEQSAYGLLMQTKGSRQIVANPFDFDWLPLITSYYGYRVHPISGVKNYHKGVDIGVPTGTDIHAGMNGTIAVGYDAGGYGNYITLTGKNNLVANYAHLDTILAANGQSVAMGDIIAKSGNTGNSTGAHLHLEIIKDGQYLDPMIFAETGNTGDNSRNDIVCGIAPPPMSDADFAVLLAEAEKHLGKSYVYGASGPDSFDCSGFACFVINHGTLKNVGRVGATALFRNYTTPIQLSEIMPGDLIFLEKTYSTPTPISHVGLYIGGGWVIHAGNPVQYARIDTAYWQEHFYAVGRLN